MSDLLISHIKKWRMVWFGFLFIGSILNAFAVQAEVLNNSPYLTFWCFFIGFIIGLVAKVRGKWLWN
jgi:uncharacterized paraquat-inducible protein A